MLIKAVKISPYSIPLVKPWKTAKGIWNRRQGWMVSITTDDELSAIGEAAPLLDAGTESHDDCFAALNRFKRVLSGQSVTSALIQLSDFEKDYPAARCAMETALANLLAQREGCSLSQWLDNQASRFVKVNATAGSLDGFAPENIQTLNLAGYQIIKLKVGVDSIENEIQKITFICAALYEKMALRLDANGAWTYDQAERFLTAIAHLPIESLEEPLSKPTAQNFFKLQKIVPFPLALDEGIWGLGVDKTLDEFSPKRIVLKPMAAGGPLSTLKIGKLAQSRNIETIVTTTIDAVPASLMALHTAAALDPLSKHAHGLATQSWLEMDQSLFQIQLGRMRVL